MNAVSWAVFAPDGQRPDDLPSTRVTGWLDSRARAEVELEQFGEGAYLVYSHNFLKYVYGTVTADELGRQGAGYGGKSMPSEIAPASYRPYDGSTRWCTVFAPIRFLLLLTDPPNRYSTVREEEG